MVVLVLDEDEPIEDRLEKLVDLVDEVDCVATVALSSQHVSSLF